MVNAIAKVKTSHDTAAAPPTRVRRRRYPLRLARANSETETALAAGRPVAVDGRTPRHHREPREVNPRAVDERHPKERLEREGRRRGRRVRRSERAEGEPSSSGPLAVRAWTARERCDPVTSPGVPEALRSGRRRGRCAGRTGR